ncbi:MAG: winged helix-turn-helix domain-containing protein [Hyphomicrobiaceae bacterium]|nr:winged helix-turn-helix domain-containing protein [Hyphomicrobiaceae bacterium]
MRICEQRFGKTMHCATMGRPLRKIGLSRQKARPSHPHKDPASQEAFKKSPATSGRVPHRPEGARVSRLVEARRAASGHVR